MVELGVSNLRPNRTPDGSFKPPIVVLGFHRGAMAKHETLTFLDVTTGPRPVCIEVQAVETR